MSLSATQTALEGFRVVGRRPVSFLVWSLIMGAVFAALFAAMFWTIGMTGQVHVADREIEPGEIVSFVAAFFGPLLLAWAVAVLGMMVVFAMLICAIFRSVLDPRSRAFAFLRLGGDELRMILLQLLLMVILAGGEAALMILIAGL